MNRQDEFDRYLMAWLAQEAVPRAPHVLHLRFGERLEQSRQRPSWVTAERWFPMETRTQIGALPRLAILLVTLGLLVAIAASTFVAGSSGRQATDPLDTMAGVPASGPTGQQASTCGQPSGGSSGDHQASGQAPAPPSDTTASTTETPSCTAGAPCDRAWPDLGGLVIGALANIGLGDPTTLLGIGTTVRADADVRATPKKTRRHDGTSSRTKRHLADVRLGLDARLARRGGCDCEQHATKGGLSVDGAVRVRNVARVAGTARTRDGLQVRAKARIADPVDVLDLLH